jgi:hypothetical protein
MECKNYLSFNVFVPIVSVLFQAFQDKNLIYKANAMEGGHAKDVRAGRHKPIGSL